MRYENVGNIFSVLFVSNIDRLVLGLMSQSVVHTCVYNSPRQQPAECQLQQDIIFRHEVLLPLDVRAVKNDWTPSWT